MSNRFKNKNVFITGVCGSVGSETLKQISLENPAQIIGIDNNESALFFLKEEYKHIKNIKLIQCDLANKNSLISLLQGTHFVFHTAAKKHVILSEDAPMEAVNTNIIGLQNVIEAAAVNKVQKVLFTSSDKAVSPTNVMGATKLIGERLILAAHDIFGSSKTVFLSTRFGNVLGSNGSVIPIFKKQIAQNNPITITDNRMSRFIMTLEQAVKLVIDSLFLAKGGEIFVTKMPVINIADLATAMFAIAQKKPKINIIGIKKGEKIYEELISEEEANRTLELKDFFIVLPSKEKTGTRYHKTQKLVNKVYQSDKEKALTAAELKQYLIKNKLC